MLTLNYEKQKLIGGSLFFSSSVCMSQSEEAWNRFLLSVLLENFVKNCHMFLVFGVDLTVLITTYVSVHKSVCHMFFVHVASHRSSAFMRACLHPHSVYIQISAVLPCTV